MIREVCDSSQAVLTAPRQLGARTDDHYRLTVSNANLVVCPSCHTHCGMWRHTSTEGLQETLGKEDDQDTAATKLVFWMHKHCGNHTHTHILYIITCLCIPERSSINWRLLLHQW